VTCDGSHKAYKGSVWHDTSVVNPSLSTNVYTCVTDGCPSAGDMEMKCKPGFRPDSPLCAVCAEGYWKQMRECFSCEKPLFGMMLLFVFMGALTGLGVLYLFYRHRKILERTNIVPHAKIIISFIMVAMTVDTQFGVVWPLNFLQVRTMLLKQ
jgi:hypothetical protein